METTSRTIISVLCPTRNRPQNVLRILESAKATVSDPKNIEFLFYLDNDASSTSFPPRVPDMNSRILLGDRILMSEMTNILGRYAFGDILFLAADDVVFETKDWELEIIKEFENSKSKILLLYGDDGIQGEALATHPFIHKNWFTTLGYAVPPLFTGDWADNWIMATASVLACKKYLPNLKFTHYHPTAGKANLDIVYAEKYLRDRKSNPQNRLETHKDLFNSDVEKLRNFINATT